MRARDRRATHDLWCAWLAWSRFRVVIPVWDKTLPTVVACLDATLRRIGGVPTYALTDNEKTVSVDHVAGIAVRNPEIVEVGRHYGMTIRTCVPADPESKGGSEATVRIAKADLVPTEVNLARSTGRSAQLEAACRALVRGGQRPGRTARPAARRSRCSPRSARGCIRCRRQPFTVAFGTTRRVNWDATISVEGVRYSVPHQLIDTRVWVRFHGDDLVVTAVGEHGADEVARHARSTPGSPSIQAEHYPPQTAAAAANGERTRGRPARPRPRSSHSARARRPGWWRPPPPGRAGSAQDGRSRRAGQAAPTRAGRPSAGDRGDRRPVRRERRAAHPRPPSRRDRRQAGDPSQRDPQPATRHQRLVRLRRHPRPERHPSSTAAHRSGRDDHW